MKRYRRILTFLVLGFVLLNSLIYMNITQEYKAEGCYKDGKEFSCNILNENGDVVEVDTYTNFTKNKLIKKSYYPYTNGVFGKEEVYEDDKTSYQNYYPSGELKEDQVGDNYTYSIGSYNIRNQGTSVEHFPSWGYRRQELIEQIKLLDYDILAIQEAGKSTDENQDQQKYIKDNLNSIYGAVTDESTMNMILYKYSKYNLLQEGSKLYDSQGGDIDEIPFKQYRGYIYTILQDKVTKKKILVVNTHLIIPKDDKRDYTDVQQKQLEQLVKDINVLEKTNQTDATFIMGDFNINSLGGFNKTPLKNLTDNNYYCTDFNEPTITLGQTKYKTEESQKEIDYICTGVHQAYIENQAIEKPVKDTSLDATNSTKTEDNYVSDHLPITATVAVQN